MPDVDIILCLIIIIVAMALFISGKIRVDLIAIGVLISLLLLKLIDVNQALSGFANQATGTIVAMFILSAGLVRTGSVQWVARRIDKLAGKGERRLILVLCLVVALLSAFIVNTAAVCIFIPIAIVLAKDRKLSSSRILMPISFASQFGGVCTLIGTSTNILVNAIAVDKGMAPFSFFEFTPLGAVMVVVGVIYLMTVARWLMPKRKGEMEKVDKYLLSDYLAELLVMESSPLVGKTWEQSKMSREAKVELSNLLREGKAVARPAKTKVRPGDLLLLHGNVQTIMDLEHKYGFELLKDTKVSDQELSSHAVRLIEVLIPPRSNLIGRTLQRSDFFRRYRSAILAIQRRGKVIRERLGDIDLESGDTLLIQGHTDDVPRLLSSTSVIVTNELTDLYFRRDKAFMAIAMILLVVVLIVFNIVPLLVAAMIGAAGMIVTRCITMEEAYDAIDWKVVFLLGGIIPLGLAMEQNGAAVWLSDLILEPLSSFGPVMVLAALYLLTTLLTQSMSNNATAVILAPVALSVAATMNIDPRPLLIAITFAASTSFATPIGYQTNTMVYSPGGYRFSDFTRVGGPLNLIFWGLAVLLIPLIWHF
ncbi:sodium:proton antiporter [Chloroflexota bacterium]